MMRSEEIQLYQLVTTRGYAYDLLSFLGNENCVQFIDADDQNTPMFSRRFHPNIKQCDELLLRLDTIK